MKGDPVWYNDVAVLWKDGRLREFFPAVDQTPEERVNALVRLIAYASVLSFAYNNHLRTLVIGGGIIAVVSLAFKPNRNERYPSSATDPVTTAQALGSPPCTKPTRDNPFGNFLLTDDTSRAPACMYDDVKDDVHKHFNEGLIRNATDVYQKENSQRQFMTMPVTSTIPDTAAFANFLYGGMRSCKVDPSYCPSLDY
jgi:hypothetical protein